MTEGTERGRRPERALEGLFALGVCVYVGVFARFALGTRASGEDWVSLDLGRDFGRFLRAQGVLTTAEFRPFSQGVMALSGALLGARSWALAAFFLGAHLAAAWGAVRVVQALGLGLRAGVLVGLLSLLDPVSADALGHLSRSQVALSRAFVFLALAALLGPAPVRAWRWLPWTLLGLLSHEQSALLAPLWALAVGFRDGARGLGRALKSRAGAGVVVLCVGYVALRVGAHEDSALRGSLGLGALGDKWALFTEHLQDFFGFHTGLGFREEALPAVGYLSRPWWTVRLLVALGWGAALGLWLWDRRLAAARVVALSALWTLGGYAPYFVALHPREPYHFNLSLVGLALPVGCALAHLWDRCEGRWRHARAGVWVLVVVSALPLGRTWLVRARPDLATELAALLGPRLRPERDAVTHLVLLDDVSPRPWHDAPSYLSELAGTWDCNDPDPSESPNLALAMLYPSRHFRVWALSPAHAGYLCMRPGDVVLEVSVRSLEEQTFSFRPLPPCDRPGGLPLALDPSTPEGAALAARFGPRGARALRAAREFWAAYRRADRGAELGQGTQLRVALQGFLHDPTTRTEARMLQESVLAASPVTYWPRDGRYPRGSLPR